jgi:hypothetical protein
MFANIAFVDHFPHETKTPSGTSLQRRLIKWFCGFHDDRTADANHKELMERVEHMSKLDDQSFAQKTVLYLNVAVIFAIGSFFYVYFSLPPFTDSQIQEFARKAIANVTVISTPV